MGYVQALRWERCLVIQGYQDQLRLLLGHEWNALTGVVGSVEFCPSVLNPGKRGCLFQSTIAGLSGGRLEHLPLSKYTAVQQL
jgi:hypothetical protein